MSAAEAAAAMTPARIFLNTSKVGVAGLPRRHHRENLGPRRRNRQ